MTLREEIAEHFASDKLGVREITSIPKKYLTYTVKQKGYYGVAIKNVKLIDIHESFEGAEISTVFIENDNGVDESFILLSSDEYLGKMKFTHICEDFVKLGHDNTYREKVQSDPYLWWKEWGMLLGDTRSRKSPYSVLGELWVYYNELKSGNKSISWEGSKGKNHDFESDNYNIEVKSTISLFNEEITVSNNFQLESNRKLYLDYIIMQENIEGISIDDIIVKLTSVGIDIDFLEKEMKELRIPANSMSRRSKYKILEYRRYTVDDNFPQINSRSFKDGKVPQGVKKVSYQVSLDKLDFDQKNCI